MIDGCFRTRYNSDQYEFKISKIVLLETVKSLLTKQLVIDIAPEFIDEPLISFLDNNIRQNPGKTSLKFLVNDPAQDLKVSMYTMEKGITMNDDLVVFLNENQHIDVNVMTV
jgi:DNA polymerase-3 subunit alpha